MQINYPYMTYRMGLVFHPICEILMIICMGVFVAAYMEKIIRPTILLFVFTVCEIV
jgi:hypothetical protein